MPAFHVIGVRFLKLKDILKGIEYEVIQGNADIDINNINYDSRKVEQNDAFFCIEGYKTDGHEYAQIAAEHGAKAIICQKSVNIDKNCTVIRMRDTREGLAISAANYYDHPSDKLKIIGITGTNGKTTTSFMLKSILEEAGYKVGLIGTIANYIGEKKLHTSRTTPESLELHKLFSEMVSEGVKYCVMEVSSHSLYLKRVYGIKFRIGIFTNLTQDHLDFHKTFENYYNAKLILFKNSQCSIINIDDQYGKKVYDDIDSEKMTFSLESKSDIMGKSLIMHSKGISFEIAYPGHDYKVELGIPGKYNVYNALGCATACIHESIDPECIRKGLMNAVVPGRCEIVTKEFNLDFDIIIDYAHTPDGLEKILNTAKEFTKGKLISVFGCGGDRDVTKRPIMGRIGTEISDFSIITSDNPRSEDPDAIIRDIVQGVSGRNYQVITDRRTAIKKAIEMAEKNDVIVIAGKGHEDYQILKDRTIEFDERKIVREILKEDNLI